MRQKSRSLIVGTVIIALCVLFFSAWVGAQTVRSFDGDKGLDLTTCNPETNRCRRQPEMDVAVNGKQVVQVTRQNVNVYDYSGKLLRSTPMSDVIRSAGLDPVPPARDAEAARRGGKGP